MKHLNIFLLASIALLLGGCSSEDATPSTVVTIDGTDFTFGDCGSQPVGPGNLEFAVSCSYHGGSEGKRYTLTKQTDAAGGALSAEIIDVPGDFGNDVNTALGIYYDCSTVGGNACLTSAVPAYDAGSKVFTLSNVEMSQTSNQTGPLNATAKHTISNTFDISGLI